MWSGKVTCGCARSRGKLKTLDLHYDNAYDQQTC